MLRFQSQYLRESLIDNSDRSIMEYCSICYYELKKAWAKKPNQQNIQNSSMIGTGEAWFLLRTMSELSLIFKDKSQSPMLKFKSTKLITYLLLMNQPEIYRKFQLELFPLIKNICHYNKSLRIQDRGSDFFKKNKYYDVANVQERQKIKLIGAKFIIFCLQVVYMMNKWMPLEAGNRKQLTVYGQAYQDLMKQGVRFPQEEDFMYFNQQKVGQILKNVQKCEAMVKDNKFSVHSTKLVKYNALNRSSISHQGSVSGYSEMPSYLQKQLQQRQQVINEYRQNLEELKEQKQFLIKQFESQKQMFRQKMLEYENELKKLYYEVKYLRKKLRKYQNRDAQNKDDQNGTIQMSEMLLFESSIQSQRSDIIDLKDKIRLLIQQNMKLKQQNVSFQKKLQQLEGQNFRESRKKIHQITMNKKQLIQELLKNDCRQNRQFQVRKAKSKQPLNMIEKIKKKNQVFQDANFLPLQKASDLNLLKKVKSQKDLNTQNEINKQQQIQNFDYNKSYLMIFQPFYLVLSSELKNRLKKCLLKNKEILYKDYYMQIGVKTALIDQITLKQEIILTNICTSHQKVQNLKNIQIQVINKNHSGEILILQDKMSRKKSNQKAKSSKQKQIPLLFEVKNLGSQQQYKFEIKFQVNNINFSKGIFLKVYYQKQLILTQQKSQVKNKQQNEKVNFGLIMPLSKIKLIKILPKLSKPVKLQKLNKNNKLSIKQENVMIKLFKMNKKVVESLSKLVKYFGEQNVYVQNNHNQKIGDLAQDKLSQDLFKNNNEICIRGAFLNKIFTIKFGYVKENNLQLLIRQNSQFQQKINQSCSNEINSKISNKNSNNNKLVKMVINYQKTTSYILADYIATQFVFILSQN